MTSVCSDGSILTATTDASAESRPRVQLFYKSYPGLGVEELHEKLLRLGKRFRERRNVEIVPVDPSLPGMAKYIDDLFRKIDEDGLLDLEDQRNLWVY